MEPKLRAPRSFVSRWLNAVAWPGREPSWCWNDSGKFPAGSCIWSAPSSTDTVMVVNQWHSNPRQGSAGMDEDGRGDGTAAQKGRSSRRVGDKSPVQDAPWVQSRRWSQPYERVQTPGHSHLGQLGHCSGPACSAQLGGSGRWHSSVFNLVDLWASIRVFFGGAPAGGLAGELRHRGSHAGNGLAEGKASGHGRGARRLHHVGLTMHVPACEGN
ncbi:hypothetical protein N657DRAFT_646175 [Parathielavia appendiculata]|uniref:Uncharacterized protein n=1 Tax=Parathielavia appendiculata TaxID=2587402 RepID=A0AAN6TZ53_9PEZI|nr:hypothetical protein N657DRAFT_646175 [Parathielavia appendiculata]